MYVKAVLPTLPMLITGRAQSITVILNGKLDVKVPAVTTHFRSYTPTGGGEAPYGTVRVFAE